MIVFLVKMSMLQVHTNIFYLAVIKYKDKDSLTIFCYFLLKMSSVVVWEQPIIATDKLASMLDLLDLWLSRELWNVLILYQILLKLCMCYVSSWYRPQYGFYCTVSQYRPPRTLPQTSIDLVGGLWRWPDDRLCKSLLPARGFKILIYLCIKLETISNVKY